jgi:probable HAF family extracellular repeat protein
MRYGVTDLGRSYDFNPIAINAAGQVVGIISDPGATDAHGFLYSRGTMTNLDPLVGAGFEPSGINAGGQVIGYLPGGPPGRTAIYDSSGQQATRFITGGYSQINDSGVIAGGSTVANGDQVTRLDGRVFSSRGGTIRIRAINESGVVVGYADDPYKAHTAIAYDPGRFQPYAALSGPSYSEDGEALGLNDKGDIVGFVGGRAVIFSKDLSTPSPTRLSDKFDVNLPGGLAPSLAYDINNLGQIVGDATNGLSNYLSGYASRGFLATDGKLVDLNTLLGPDSELWTITSARGINDRGQIVAYGTNRGGTIHALLLSPQAVPEPSTLVALAVGFPSLTALMRRRSRLNRTRMPHPVE